MLIPIKKGHAVRPDGVLMTPLKARYALLQQMSKIQQLLIYDH